MFSLQYLDEAKDDIRKIAAYISLKSSDKSIGLKFAKDLTFACEKLASSPILRGIKRPELLPNIWSYPYQNYIIFFQYIEDGQILQIVRILRASQDIKTELDK